MKGLRAFTYALPSLRLGTSNAGQLGRPENPGAEEIMANLWESSRRRLGNGNDIDDCYEPHPSFKLADLPLRALSSGSMHNALVTASGQLLAWGYDSHGQVGTLGQPKDATPRIVHRPHPVDLDNNEQVKSVSCSGFHTVAVSSSHHLYAWGRSDFGRCGVRAPISHRGEADTIPIWQPRKVENVEGIERASAGGFFTVALLEDKRSAIAFGGNGNGELGTGTKSKFEWQPQKVQLDDVLGNGETIVGLSSGGFHTCFLTSEGRVLSFGDNHSNQLGTKSNASSSPKPTMADVLPPLEYVTALSCGPIFTTVVTNKKKLWLLGGGPSHHHTQLVYEIHDENRSISLPEKQGAHHLLFFVD